jgi:hypothetical protein
MGAIGPVLGVRTKDMPGIFEDEGRETGPIAPYPLGAGRIWTGIVVADALWRAAPRRPPLLAPGQSRSRQDRNPVVNRP